MSTTVVYVFFDPQCPHCGHLWNASIPLQKKARFVWMPVGLINATSSAQGATLLSAADPAQAMTEHEASLIAGKGGIGAGADVTDEAKQAVDSNTKLFNNLGLEGVPFTVVKNARTGQTGHPWRLDGHRRTGPADRRRRALIAAAGTQRPAVHRASAGRVKPSTKRRRRTMRGSAVAREEGRHDALAAGRRRHHDRRGRARRVARRAFRRRLGARRRDGRHHAAERDTTTWCCSTWACPGVDGVEVLRRAARAQERHTGADRHRPRRGAGPRSPAWTPAPTTTCSSPTTWTNCWRVSAR